MLVNEELDGDWSRFRVEHAPAAPVYGHTAYGVQITGGSTTTWSELDRYRQVGAVARTLVSAAILLGASGRQLAKHPLRPIRSLYYLLPPLRNSRANRTTPATSPTSYLERRLRATLDG